MPHAERKLSEAWTGSFPLLYVKLPLGSLFLYKKSLRFVLREIIFSSPGREEEKARREGLVP